MPMAGLFHSNFQERVERAAEAALKRSGTVGPLELFQEMGLLQAFHVESWRKGDEHYHHEGEEWIYVLSGRLTLSLAGRTYDLVPGDAAHFDSRLPHRLIANGKKDAEVLLVAAPTGNSSQVMLSATAQHRAIPAIRLLDLKPQIETGGFAKPRRTRISFPKTKLKPNNRKEKP